MIQVRRSEDRGTAERGWLKAKHTFSFSDYYDPEHMGFSVLRVINEDRIKGGSGFGMHGHNDMEIITYIISGELRHEDSMGNSAIIKPGEVQRMSAGTGVRHSEVNPHPENETHLLQIWILPDTQSVEPGYEQKSYEQELATGHPILVASKNGDQGSVRLHQDIKLYAARVKPSYEHDFSIQTDRHAWVQVVRGELEVNGEHKIKAGDGLMASNENLLKIKSLSDSEYLFFDLPS